MNALQELLYPIWPSISIFQSWKLRGIWKSGLQFSRKNVENLVLLVGHIGRSNPLTVSFKIFRSFLFPLIMLTFAALSTSLKIIFKIKLILYIYVAGFRLSAMNRPYCMCNRQLIWEGTQTPPCSSRSSGTFLNRVRLWCPLIWVAHCTCNIRSSLYPILIPFKRW